LLGFSGARIQSSNTQLDNVINARANVAHTSKYKDMTHSTHNTCAESVIDEVALQTPGRRDDALTCPQRRKFIFALAIWHQRIKLVCVFCVATTGN
jgi:hypothetical protein